MSEPIANDASAFVSLLIEHSNGTFEVMLRRVQVEGEAALVPLQITPISGSRPAEITHGCLGNAISMKRWMDEHLDVFLEGLTSFA